MNPVKSVLRTALRKEGDSISILCLPYDGQFEQMLSSVPNVVLYLLGYTSRFGGMEALPNRKNIRFIENPNLIPLGVDIDIVLSNEREKQFPIGNQISAALHIPHILVDHIDISGIKKEVIKQMAEQYRPTKCISVSESIGDFWGGTQTIKYAIPTLPFFPVKKNKVVVVGNFSMPDGSALQGVLASTNIPYQIYNYGQINSDIYRDASIYINMTQDNNIPVPMLQAMGEGCAIISNEVPALQDILQPNTNCLIMNHIGELPNLINKLQDEKVRKPLVLEGYKTIENMSFDNFVKEWSVVLNDVVKTVYIK